MKLSTRHLRRLIDHYTMLANIDMIDGGGCYLIFPDNPIWLKEYAVWNDQTHIIEYTFIGEDWTLTLIDVPKKGGRLLHIIECNGHSKQIEDSLRGII